MDTKFQKKHESDMTRKEKRELEREKLASMHGWERIEYILTYYKLYFVAALLLILAVIGTVKWMDNMKDENYLYTVVMNAPADGEHFMEDFRNSLGDSEEHHKYVLDTSIYLTKNADGEEVLDYSSTVNMTTMVGSATADVFICPESIYKRYGEEGEDILYDISELMGDAFVAEHKDICEKNAIRVEDSEVLKKYGLLNGQPAYLIVFEYSRHPEIAKEFIEFVVK